MPKTSFDYLWELLAPTGEFVYRERASRILRLFLSGLSECEISYRLKISQQAVNQSLRRTIERLKVVACILYNRGPSHNGDFPTSVESFSDQCRSVVGPLSNHYRE